MKKLPFKAAWVVAPLFALFLACSTPEADQPSSSLATDSPASRSQDASRSAAQSQSGQSGAEQGIVGQARRIQSLREQKVRLLVQERVRSARSALADGRLDEAESELGAALDLQPQNQEALSLLEQVRLAQGKPAGAVTGSSQDARLRLQARIERLRAEAQATAERGFRLLQEGDLEEAQGALRLAKATVTSTPYKIDWGDLPTRIDQALLQTQDELGVAASARKDQEMRQTFEQLQSEESAQRKARRRRLKIMLQDAIEAFDNEKFDDTVNLTEEILRLDPLNEKAVELRDTAYRARHERISDKFVLERKERFKRWLEDLEEAKIPSSEILQTPDPDFWADITKKRRIYRDLGIQQDESPEDARLRAEVAKAKIPGLRVDGETSLEAVVDQLRTFTDIPFVVTPAAVDAVDSEGIEFNLNLGNQITVENALKVITDSAGAEVTYTFRNGVVYITTVSKAQGNMILRAHDVQDLTVQLPDFSGPKISEIRLPDSASFGTEEEEPAFGGVLPEAKPLMDPANLETLITQTISPASWEAEGASIRFSNGFLVVSQTPELQARVAAFLEDLRRYTSSMVTIEARFLTIQKDFLRELGVDFRGLGGFPSATDLVTLDDVNSGLEDNASRGLDNEGPGLPTGAESNPSAGAFFTEGNSDYRARTENILGPFGDRLTSVGGLTMQFVFLDDTQYGFILRAVEKSNRAEELMSHTLSVQNTQRGFITVLNQVTYIQDFNVEVAQAAIIGDPEVGVINDGIVLDVRPTISHDRKYITLELRPTVATLVRPIQEFTSSLAGLTTPVTLQLPELQVSSANTTVVVPDGGTVVIGGLKKLLNIQQRAEVPWLAKIPILSLLFKDEGEAYENQDVIILVRAHLTDARDLMKRFETQ